MLTCRCRLDRLVRLSEAYQVRLGYREGHARDGDDQTTRQFAVDVGQLVYFAATISCAIPRAHPDARRGLADVERHGDQLRDQDRIGGAPDRRRSSSPPLRVERTVPLAVAAESAHLFHAIGVERIPTAVMARVSTVPQVDHNPRLQTSEEVSSGTEKHGVVMSGALAFHDGRDAVEVVETSRALVPDEVGLLFPDSGRSVSVCRRWHEAPTSPVPRLIEGSRK